MLARRARSVRLTPNGTGARAKRPVLGPIQPPQAPSKRHQPERLPRQNPKATVIGGVHIPQTASRVGFFSDLLEILTRPPGTNGFVVVRRRWVVERTFAWIMKCWCLVRDYEQFTTIAETLITIAAIATLVRRTA